ncbi:hypothetical protein [Marinomonas fungiae]|uniref:hypothetical protein n=1 Tax=Marinomonas fungiae TaxID=1137284 RepID=UPI003A92AAC8
MEKWILWLLLEATTVMVVASLWLIWRGVVLRKKTDTPEENNVHEAEQTERPSSSELADQSNEQSYKTFAQELETQANHAADHLVALRESNNLDHVTRVKIWGTLVKAERAIVLNEENHQPQSILNRFMASIIHTLEAIKSKQLNTHTLTKALKDIDDEFIQASELLISKEELIHNQRDLHLELHKSIDYSEQKLKKLSDKFKELERLKLELKRQQQQIDKLEKHTGSDDKYVTTQPPKEHETLPHHSTRHLHQLERLSKRQQAIIEHLQAQLKDSDHSKNDQQEQESQHMALNRIERLSEESKSLISQLQMELDDANLSINSLKQDISVKDKQLEAMDAQIKAAEGGVLEEFQALSSNKRQTIEALLDDFESIKSDAQAATQPFSQQEKEVRNLEQILKESETCVQLLAQELENAEAENSTLREQIESSLTLNPVSQTSEKAELNALREENHELVKQVHEMKEQLINQVSDSSEKALRNQYNKKSLELDRLQLAYSDLERKYLGTLR